jgi:hypothetical protein
MDFRAMHVGLPGWRPIGSIAAVAFLCAGLAAAVSGVPGASAGAGTQEPDLGAAAAGCDVTEPNATSVPGEPVAPGFVDSEEPDIISSQGLYVSFGERSTVVVPRRGSPQPPGTAVALWRGRHGKFGGKFGWRRDSRAWGTLRVKVRSQSGRSVGRGLYSNHLGPTSRVVPGGIVFPREGCWKITGMSGDATLRATIWVVDLRDQ